jgi:acetyl esterase/lipase
MAFTLDPAVAKGLEPMAAAMAAAVPLAPEHPYPTPVEDCYIGVQWLAEHAGELGVDAARIAVMGDSAGGGLGAAVTLLARDRGGPALSHQILIYPMLDDRNTIPDPEIVPFAVWSYDDNVTGWGALLGDAIGGVNVAAYARRLAPPIYRACPPATSRWASSISSATRI